VAVSPVKDSVPPKETAVLEVIKPEVSSTLSPATNLSGARSPLHPSLPAKPGVTPSSKPTSSQDVAPVKATPTTAIAAPSPTPVPTPAPAAAPSPAPLAPPVDDQIARLEESKQRWSWLALRTARDQYLQYFGKIGTGDLTLLQQEIELGIEKEKQEREKAQKGEEPSSGATGLSVASATGAGEERVASPSIIGGSGDNDAEKMSEMEESRPTHDTQGDIKMEL
jgi:THO complex subunit 1